MQISGELYKYGRIEFAFDENVDYILVKRPDGRENIAYSFDYQPINISYDEEGLEHISLAGNTCSCCRYTPDFTGTATVEAYSGNQKTAACTVEINPSDKHGYIEISKKDKRYFAYTDGTPFFSVGINLAFLTPYGKSDGTEFGLSGRYKFLGLRQYERWFKKCSENGVNVARIWLGHEYLCPDTENTYEFKLEQFSKIDKLIELAKKYDIKLKLTLEQFRNFDYVHVADTNSYSDDVFRKFNKRLYDNNEKCVDGNEWLNENKWRRAWLAKVNEFSKRYSGDTSVFAIELWNEMNCVGDFEHRADVIEWNRFMLPEVRKLFPENLVINSLGSLDCDACKELYNDFCWEESDFIQIHRYLDQGAEFDDCRNDPVDVIKGGIEKINEKSRAIYIAETGAVNNNHSGPFKYYVNDDRGIIFADTVYSPLFCGSCGCGNIWHWDERYVEFKNLYHMFKPVSELIDGIKFDEENFVFKDFSDDKLHVLVLCGTMHTLMYIRNKTDNWKNTLRDLAESNTVDEFKLTMPGISSVVEYPIWNEDTTHIEFDSDKLYLKNIKYGTMLKLKQKAVNHDILERG